MEPNKLGPVLGRILGALLVVLSVAGVARAAYWLLAPLVPAVVVLIVLGAVYWIVFRGFRRR